MKRDIEFIYEMGTIRFIDRMWKRFSRYDFANLAEHHFRMFWIAMIIAAGEKNADTGKIAKMVLLHDIAESRTGYVDYLARQYVDRNEELGINDMLDGTTIKDEFLSLWHEYEAKESIEAKIVKDADNLDVDFELAEQAMHGSTLHADWRDNREFVAKNKLYTESAKKLFDEIGKDNPHNWHLHGRTRSNAGDWRKV